MAFSGGTYTLPAGNPVTAGNTIEASWANTTLNDIATALSTCVLKDGTQTLTANIPMGGFKLTGLAAGSSANDSVRMAQLQGGSVSYLTGTAGTNTITALGTPTVTALATGMRFTFIPANSNTAAATLQIDSTSALSIFWNNVALIGGELQQNVPVTVLYDGTQYQLIASGAHANTFAIPDTMRIQAAGDRTKQLAVSLTGISTATTRTLTMPDSNVNLNGLTGTQTAATVYAGPISGAAALPSFRALSGADGASLVLIQSTTASAAASVAFTTGLSSTYSSYYITIANVVPATDNSDLYFLASTSGGASYLNSYNSITTYTLANAGGTATIDQLGTSVITLMAGLGNATGENITGQFILSDPANAVVYKHLVGTHGGRRATSFQIISTTSAEVPTATPINAIKFEMSSGNINGTFSLYGIRKA